MRGRPRNAAAEARHEAAQARRKAAQARREAAQVRRASAQARQSRHPRAVNLRAAAVSEEEEEINEMVEIEERLQAVINRPFDGLQQPPQPLQAQQVPQAPSAAVLVVDAALCKICRTVQVNRIMTCGHALCEECAQRMYEPARERYFTLEVNLGRVFRPELHVLCPIYRTPCGRWPLRNLYL